MEAGSEASTEGARNHGMALTDCPPVGDSLAFALFWLDSANQVLDLSLQ